MKTSFNDFQTHLNAFDLCQIPLFIRKVTIANVCKGSMRVSLFTLGARARLSLGTNVNTPFFQGPTPEYGHGVRARVLGRNLVLRH